MHLTILIHLSIVNCRNYHNQLSLRQPKFGFTFFSFHLLVGGAMSICTYTNQNSQDDLSLNSQLDLV